MSLFVAGAVFGEVQVSLFVAGAVFGEVQVSLFMLGSWSDHSRIGRALEMTFHPFSANIFEILDGHFSWQAQYLVSLDYDACCSAHCK